MLSRDILHGVLIIVSIVFNGIAGNFDDDFAVERPGYLLNGNEGQHLDNVKQHDSDENLHVTPDQEKITKRSPIEVSNQFPPASYAGRGGIGWWPWNNGASTVRRSYFIPRLGKRTNQEDSEEHNESNDDNELTPAEAEVLKDLLMRNANNDYSFEDKDTLDDYKDQELITRDERSSSYAFVPRLGKKSFSFSPRLGKKAYSFAPRLGKKAYSFAPRLGKKAYSFAPRLGKKAYSFAPRLGKKAYSFSPRLGKKASVKY